MEPRSTLQYWMLLKRELSHYNERGSAKIVHVRYLEIKKGIRTNDGNPIALAIQNTFPYIEDVQVQGQTLTFSLQKLAYRLILVFELNEWLIRWYQDHSLVQPLFFALVIPNDENRGHAYVFPNDY